MKISQRGIKLLDENKNKTREERVGRFDWELTRIEREESGIGGKGISARDFNYRKMNLKNFSPNIPTIKTANIKTERSIRSQFHIKSPVSITFRTFPHILPPRDLNYSDFKNYHETSHTRRKLVKKYWNFKDNINRFKSDLKDRMKMQPLDKEEILKNTVFAKPAETYADKLFKLNLIGSLK